MKYIAPRTHKTIHNIKCPLDDMVNDWKHSLLEARDSPLASYLLYINPISIDEFGSVFAFNIIVRISELSLTFLQMLIFRQTHFNCPTTCGVIPLFFISIVAQPVPNHSQFLF